jgi:NADH-quinone oxidoreductase subunit L
MLMGASTVLAILGILFARNVYKNGLDKANGMAAKMSGLHKLLWNKYYVDEVYHGLIAQPILALSRDALWKIVDVVVIDGVVNGSARLVGATGSVIRKAQSGVAQNYALVMLVGIVVLIGIVLLPLL